MSLETSSATPEVTPPATEVTEHSSPAAPPPEQTEPADSTSNATAPPPQQTEPADSTSNATAPPPQQTEPTDSTPNATAPPPQQTENANNDETQEQDVTNENENFSVKSGDDEDDETGENSQPETNETEDENTSPSANDLIEDFQKHMNIVGTMHDKFLERLQNLHELDNKIGSSQQKLKQHKDALREILEQIDNLREFVSDSLSE